jgi:putative PIN family toxin of toxin-antitoxin system
MKSNYGVAVNFELCYIASNMKIVMDTTTLVAAKRSPLGASAEIVSRVLTGKLAAVCSVPLFLEYEAVVTRTEHVLASGGDEGEIINVLDALAKTVQPILIRFLWRPVLRDANDDMVLEAAINGQANVIVTFNVKDFLPQASGMGLMVKTPSEFLKMKTAPN